MLSRRTALAGLLLAGAQPAAALPDPALPGLSRAYLEGRFGQIHLRVARPPGGNRARAPALVCFHQTPLSGRMFERAMPHFAQGRTVIAVDTPGYGESDRPAERPTLAAYGDAMLDALIGKFGRRFDLLGYHTGAAIAADLAARRPEVRWLVLVAMPYFDETRRAAFLKQLDDGAPPFQDDGAHLVAMWSGSFKTRAPGQSIDDVARLAAEKQRAGRFNEWALRAAMEDPLGPRLAAIKRATLVLAPHDGLEGPSAAAAAAIAGAKLVDLPTHRYGLFDAAPHELAGHILAFLDA